MRWYKKLARILLILSVINFVHAAPVVAQEREVCVSVVDAAVDGTTRPANAPDGTNAPPIPRSSDSGHWREHNPKSRTDSNGSPELSNPAPHLYDELEPLYPSLPHDDFHAFNLAWLSGPRPSSPGLSHDNSDLLSSFSLYFKSLSDSEFMSPTHDTHPPGFPQTVSSPDDSHPPGIPKTVSPPDDSHSGSSRLPDHVPPPASLLGWSPKDPVPYSPGLWVPVDSISTSWPGSSQDHVPSTPNLGDDLPSDNHPLPTSPSNPGPSTERNLPPSTKRPRPEEPETWRSLLNTQGHVPPPPNPGDDLPSDKYRLPTSPSNPEPSTELPPSVKRPRPDWRSALRKMFKGKL